MSRWLSYSQSMMLNAPTPTSTHHGTPPFLLLAVTGELAPVLRACAC